MHAACDTNGECPLLTFLGDLLDRRDKDAAAMLRLIEHVAENGQAA